MTKIDSLLGDYDCISKKYHGLCKAGKRDAAEVVVQSNILFFMEIIEALRNERTEPQACCFKDSLGAFCKTHSPHPVTETKSIDIVEKLAEGVKVTVEEEATGLPCRECGKKGWHRCEVRPQSDYYTKDEIDKMFAVTDEFMLQQINDVRLAFDMAKITKPLK